MGRPSGGPPCRSAQLGVVKTSYPWQSPGSRARSKLEPRHTFVILDPRHTVTFELTSQQEK